MAGRSAKKLDKGYSGKLQSIDSYRLENSYAIFADSKQRLRPLSFLSRTGNVSQAFLRVIIQDSTFHKADCCCGSLQTGRLRGFLSD